MQKDVHAAFRGLLHMEADPDADALFEDADQQHLEKGKAGNRADYPGHR